MSDSQFSLDQPVYPGARAALHGNEATEETEPAGDAPTETPDTSEKIEIQGKSYSAEEIEEALHGGLRQADYTRKTQEIAEMRRELEARERALEERESSWDEEEPSEPVRTDYDDPFERRFSSMEDKLNKLYERNEAQAARERAEQEQMKEVEQLQAEVDRYAARPLFNREVVLKYMVDNNLGVGQVGVAYQALYGGDLGRSLGEVEAMKRLGGLTPLGAGRTSVSPGFTHPNEAPGAEVDFHGMSLADVTRAALADPNRPRV